MKRFILALVMVAFLVPTSVYAACGDGKIDEGRGENCDPRAEVANGGCNAGYICAPSVCQCVVDYGHRAESGKTKRKVKVKR